MNNITLNIFRTFLLELRQHEWRDGAFPEGPIFRLIGALGENLSPKLYPVKLDEGVDRKPTLGLYSLKQARRQGRKRDLSDVFQVGGLIVNKSVAPANGVVEITTSEAASEPSPSLPWTISQTLRTDGMVWQAFVDNGHGQWVLRESINIKSLISAPLDYDAPPTLLTAFIEFLRRSLLSWHDRQDPATLASYFASHAREENKRLLREESDSIAAFQGILERDTGFRINDPQYAAHVLTAVRVFELVYGEISRASIPTVTFNASADFVHWTRASGPLTNSLKFLLDTVSDFFAFADDLRNNDHCLKVFCLCFLSETAHSRQHLDGLTFEHMRSAISQAMHISVVLPHNKHDLRLCDPNAGHGDFLLAALYTFPEYYTEISLIASEANPLGAQMTRLRLEAATQRPVVHTSRFSFFGAEPGEVINQHKANYSSIVGLRNIFRDGCVDIFDASESVVLGEVRPHIARGTDLALDDAPNPSVAFLGWGAKIQGSEYGTTRYMEALRTAFAREAILASSLRLPASWAEDVEYANPRAEFSRDAKEIFVNTDEMGERPRDKRLTRGDILVLTASAKLIDRSPSERYHRVSPRQKNGYSLLPITESPWYDTWLPLDELAMRKPFNGPIERRGMNLIDTDKERLLERLYDYFSDMPNEQLKKKYREMATSTKLFNARETRDTLRRESNGLLPGIVDYSFRPFDTRLAAVDNLRPLFSEPANELFSLARDGDLFLIAEKGMNRVNVGIPAWFGGIPCDYDFFAGRSGHFPVWLRPNKVPRGVTVDAHSSRVANLSEGVRAFLEQLGYENPDTSQETAELLWLHALAVLYTPAYLRENEEALRFGWPRVPIPGLTDDWPPDDARRILNASAALGRQVAELLSHNNDACGGQDLLAGRLIVDGRPVSPDDVDANALTLTAGWGIKAKGNAVRPRPGRISGRQYGSGEEEELIEIARQMGVDNLNVDGVFGCAVGDVYLNDRAYWSGIPEWTWEYRIGGRQVLPKWLSYRESAIIERPLTANEVRFFTEMVARLIKLSVLRVKLDALWEEIW